jgi:hypothetical protein
MVGGPPFFIPDLSSGTHDIVLDGEAFGVSLGRLIDNCQLFRENRFLLVRLKMADDGSQVEGLAEHAVTWFAPREICNDNMRALVVTDLHLTEHHPLAKTLAHIFRTLAQIILDK